jgi:glycosyltransferase involved in cell wall biosynthesis
VALSGGARLVVPSRTLERIARETWRLAPARVSYVANGIDLDRFAAAAPDPALRERPGQILIGTVGALRPEKNQRRLVRAAAAVPGDVRLVIVGEGAERAALLAEAAACGIAGRLVLAGQRPDPERVLAALDIFALSSDTEQMPISLIEAMAAGRACAATDVGDVRAMLPEAQGPFVVPAEGEAALGRALATLAADPALRAALGGLNRARAAAELDRRTMVARWAALLDGAMAAARG